jgi:phage terminase large subunit-like protein
MAAANAVAVINDVGDVKLSKAKATQRIDPLIAAIMATYAVSDGRAETLGNDLSWWIA